METITTTNTTAACLVDDCPGEVEIHRRGFWSACDHRGHVHELGDGRASRSTMDEALDDGDNSPRFRTWQAGQRERDARPRARLTPDERRSRILRRIAANCT